MKLIIKEHKEPVDGEIRKRKSFLLFPKIIGNELKWLMNAKWSEKYCVKTEWWINGWFELRSSINIWWEPIEWIDD